MTTNFNIFFEGAHTRGRDMFVTDLTPGQTVLRLVRPRHGEYHIVEYTVVKALKTRLVLADPTATDPSREVRLLVDNSKYAFPAGRVEGTIEGTANSWSRDNFDIATEDDRELLEQIVARRAEALQQEAAVTSARQVLREIVATATPNAASIDEAIAKLTALRATLS